MRPITWGQRGGWQGTYLSQLSSTGSLVRDLLLFAALGFEGDKDINARGRSSKPAGALAAACTWGAALEPDHVATCSPAFGFESSEAAGAPGGASLRWWGLMQVVTIGDGVRRSLALTSEQ